MYIHRKTAVHNVLFSLIYFFLLLCIIIIVSLAVITALRFGCAPPNITIVIIWTTTMLISRIENVFFAGPAEPIGLYPPQLRLYAFCCIGAPIYYVYVSLFDDDRRGFDTIIILGTIIIIRAGILMP